MCFFLVFNKSGIKEEFEKAYKFSGFYSLVQKQTLDAVTSKARNLEGFPNSPADHFS
jgi:hypothetical protein